MSIVNWQPTRRWRPPIDLWPILRMSGGLAAVAMFCAVMIAGLLAYAS